jgi:hypothetical protein
MKLERLNVTVLVCNPRYSGGGVRRINEFKAIPNQKVVRSCLKSKMKTEGLRCGSSNRLLD